MRLLLEGKKPQAAYRAVAAAFQMHPVCSTGDATFFVLQIHARCVRKVSRETEAALRPQMGCLRQVQGSIPTTSSPLPWGSACRRDQFLWSVSPYISSESVN